MEQVSSLPETGKREYTAREKLANWLHYHIWCLVAVGFLTVVFSSMILTKAQERQQRADYAIAYIGTRELPGECVENLKLRLGELGEDVDGDGRVTVDVNQYIVSDTTAVTDTASFGRSAEIALLTDIDEMESYFFLVEYPEEFQQDFQLMAHLDGSASAEDDFGVWDKVFRLGDCPALAGLELAAENGSFLQDLYLGRRCFVTANPKGDTPENAALWAALTADATPVQTPTE